MIKCSECPRCKDTYPDKLDFYGNHFYICGMSGNKVYTKPRRERKYSGKGWMKFSESSCGIYSTFDDAFNAMTETERKRWNESHRQYKQITINDILFGED